MSDVSYYPDNAEDLLTWHCNAVRANFGEGAVDLVVQSMKNNGEEFGEQLESVRSEALREMRRGTGAEQRILERRSVVRTRTRLRSVSARCWLGYSYS